jgi:energy-coupling factor transporter ATP-binding protein EcfA2
MVDFYQILSRENKDGTMELFPDFVVCRSRDLMVQGRTFYAIWDEEKGLWSRDEYDVQRLVDEDLYREADDLFRKTGMRHHVRDMRSFASNSWSQFRKYIAHISDNSVPLDTRIIFANTDVKKTDYASKTLPYSIGEGDTSAWNELIGTLYNPEERAKIEWAIGSVIAGDSKKIQKFLVFYGPPASGKSTVLNIINKMFEGYTTTFDGRALGRSDSTFATEAFRGNPLVAIQHDGNLSRLEDNARLNSIIAHENMTMNEKYKSSYTARVDAMLFMGSNQPVKISDAKSGIIRRLIDVHPTGVSIPNKHYTTLLAQIDFDLGAIAHQCLSVFLEMGKNYYSAYRPLEMMLQTDIFFNFIEAHYDLFKSQNGTTLKQAYALYKEYCNESGIDRPLPQYKMREELRNYFDEFRDRGEVEGQNVRSLYTGFSAEKFKAPKPDAPTFSLVLDEKKSLLDELLGACPAQYAKKNETPSKKWGRVTATLADIDSGKLHFVKVPENHIVIDFDLKGNDGERSLERNLEVASLWPATYAELSKSGSGVHLHYVYKGDVKELATDYSEGIEVKVYTGDSALRRKLSRCNSVPVATISSGLPLKPKKEKMLKTKTITSEKGLRDLIARNLRKEIHPGTKPSVDFIKKILDDAYESGMKYDVTDLRNRIIAFANNSTNQAQVALKVVQEMKFASENGDSDVHVEVDDDRIVFFDVETYINLFVICWKFQGDDTVVKMVNPSAQEVEALFRLKLVGFYNRRYDNHMLYAASMGKTNEQLFRISEKLIEGSRTAPYGAAYNLSYADIWDFSTEKKSLKKFEIDLGILHMELDLPWDKPVEEKNWERVVEYCANDVRATEAVFEDRKGDFVARQILAELSGLTVNDTTQRHTAKIIFGDNKTPQREFVYTDLSKEFPGYKFELGKSSYRDENPGEGGYVYAEPGIYQNVVVLDIVSMHPATIEILNLFGPYTKKYSELKEARVAIKRQDYDKARKMLNGKLAQFLEGAEEEEVGRHGTDLSYALRIALNIVYGLTSASFDNPFKDNRNIDNIVAKRGALFMIDLKKYLQNEGIQVIHIKTDSVKIPNADQATIDKVIAFGKQYGYDFDHEATYDKFCLVNDAVYVAGIWPVPWEEPYPRWEWTAVGAQFQHPYVFKTLFSEEPIEFADFCEGRSVVKGTMYLDRTGEEERDHTKMRHIGKTGQFVPVNEGGGILWRMFEDKYYAVAGTKGHLWMEADIAATKGDKLQVDMGYFNKLRDEAIRTIDQFGSFDNFIKKEK